MHVCIYIYIFERWWIQLIKEEGGGGGKREGYIINPVTKDEILIYQKMNHSQKSHPHAHTHSVCLTHAHTHTQWVLRTHSHKRVAPENHGRYYRW